jgi:AcrR family transcriptional regulator
MATPTPQPTREAILDAAERLFSQHGVDGVAVRDLARELGLTPSSLYNHFPGKQALYEAVLERGLRPIVEVIAASWNGEIRRDSVAGTLDVLVAHLAQHRHLGRLVYRALLEEKDSVQQLLNRWLAPLYTEGVAVVGSAAEAAGWEQDEVTHLALGLFGLVFAYFVNGEALRRFGPWPPDPSDPELLAVQRRFLEKAILRLIGPRPRGAADPNRRRTPNG